jgi:hypothetical protein
MIRQRRNKDFFITVMTNPFWQSIGELSGSGITMIPAMTEEHTPDNKSALSVLHARG